MHNDSRFDRSIRFFGDDGQQRLQAARIGVVGAGGLGSHVVQQPALLGVGTLVVIDPKEMDDTTAIAT